jgi:hypothetical protein
MTFSTFSLLATIASRLPTRTASAFAYSGSGGGAFGTFRRSGSLKGGQTDALVIFATYR